MLLFHQQTDPAQRKTGNQQYDENQNTARRYALGYPGILSRSTAEAMKSRPVEG